MNTKIHVKISDKDENIIGTFAIDFYKRTKEEFQLDPNTFYREYNEGKLHEKNIEMMVVGSSPFSLKDMEEKKAHIHQGNDKQWYVCYTPEVRDIHEAIKIATFWSILTAFHMKYQADIGFFLSFNDWMNARSVDDKKVNGMDEFPAWIVKNRNWKVEFNVTNEMEEVIAKCRQELMNVLVLKQ